MRLVASFIRDELRKDIPKAVHHRYSGRPWAADQYEARIARLINASEDTDRAGIEKYAAELRDEAMQAILAHE